MGVWLGPRGGKKKLSIYKAPDSGTFTARNYVWMEDSQGLAPSIDYSGALNVSISKTYQAGYGPDKCGIAVTNDTFDLTGYNKVIVKFSSLNKEHGHIAVYLSSSGTEFSLRNDLNKYDFSDSPVKLDVSKLPAGAYHFGIAIEAHDAGNYTTSIAISSIEATE